MGQLKDGGGKQHSNDHHSSKLTQWSANIIEDAFLRRGFATSCHILNFLLQSPTISTPLGPPPPSLHPKFLDRFLCIAFSSFKEEGFTGFGGFYVFVSLPRILNKQLYYNFWYVRV